MCYNWRVKESQGESREVKGNQGESRESKGFRSYKKMLMNGRPDVLQAETGRNIRNKRGKSGERDLCIR